LLDVTLLCDVCAQSVLVEFKSTAGQKIALHVLVSCVITRLLESEMMHIDLLSLLFLLLSTAYECSNYRPVQSKIKFFVTASFFT